MIFSNSKPTVIISGGSSGIGFSMVNFLLKQAFNVINIDISRVKNQNKSYRYLYCNLSKVNFIEKTLKSLKKEKNIVGLINCAAITISQNSLEYKIDNWNKTFLTNLTAPFFLSQFISKIMIKNKIKGSIVNISSISAKVAMPNNPAYNASKAGLISLTKSLAVDLAKFKIRVNSILPGYTITPLNSKSLKDRKLKSERTKKTLVKRWALSSEYNEAALFLLDNSKSSYMTGSDITIDGGWTAKGL